MVMTVLFIEEDDGESDNFLVVLVKIYPNEKKKETKNLPQIKVNLISASLNLQSKCCATLYD